MMLSYNPLRIFMPVGVVLTVLGIVKLVYDLVDKDFRVATNTLLILFAAFQVIAIGLLADLVVRVTKPTPKSSRLRSSDRAHVHLAMRSDHCRQIVSRDCGRGVRRSRKRQGSQRGSERVGVVRSDEHTSARGHNLGEAAHPRSDDRPAERERLDCDETEPLPPAGNDDGVGQRPPGVQRGARQMGSTKVTASPRPNRSLCATSGPRSGPLPTSSRRTSAPRGAGSGQRFQQHVEPLLGRRTADRDRPPRGPRRDGSASGAGASTTIGMGTTPLRVRLEAEEQRVPLAAMDPDTAATKAARDATRATERSTPRAPRARRRCRGA